MSKQNDDKSKEFSRRDFLKTAGIGAVGLGLGQSLLNAGPVKAEQAQTTYRSEGGSVTAKPYNVLFILTDQERYYPELLGKGYWPGRDRLAKMGTTFENHQVCAMVCTPSRSVIFTGQHIQHTRMFDNTNFPWMSDMSFDIPTIGHMMRDAGYYTTYQGKWHLNGQLHEHFTPEDPLKLVGHDLMEKYGFSDFTGIGDIIGDTLGGYQNDEIITAVAEGWLRRKGKPLNQEGKPWFLTLSLVNPHDVMFYNTDQPGQKVQKDPKVMLNIKHEPDDKIYKQQWDLPLSPTRQQKWDRPGRPGAHLEYQKCREFLVGRFPNEDARWNRLQNYYLNCISDCDRSVDSILTELENQGMLDNTIVILTSDHGELCGAHSMYGKGACAFREQNNVNFIIYHPDAVGGKKCKAVTSHADLVPTILKMTGADKKQKPKVVNKLHGHDVSHLLNKPEKASPQAVRDGALYCFSMWAYMDAEWLGKIAQAQAAGKKMTLETAPKPDINKRSVIRTVFDGRYKFSRYFNTTHHNRPGTMEQIFSVNDIELYDVKEDPNEITNLAIDKKKYGELIMAMNDKLNKVIDDEVGEDMGAYLPNIKGANWALEHFDP